MSDHDVQALSGIDIHVYEAVAALVVEGRSASLADVAHATGRPEVEVRQSLAHLVAQGYVLPSGEEYALGRHDFEVDY
ncbi:hypothetical protein OIE66_28470 [Nonomuraea sp. NBC_01738]|uniref:hypothetical protein n=1 Tax=Nonomuraea sp. NBC_01738 TaxID=2976003 RepID=UPI002E0DFF44|nr:hypothetical protein OIE66_28470 [Nonomuraea sp. NBC_01738]